MQKKNKGRFGISAKISFVKNCVAFLMKKKIVKHLSLSVIFSKNEANLKVLPVFVLHIVK